MRIWGGMNSIGTRVFTWLNGRNVGQDGLGNRYFEDRRPRAGLRSRRWVLYAGVPEASDISETWCPLNRKRI